GIGRRGSGRAGGRVGRRGSTRDSSRRSRRSRRSPSYLAATASSMHKRRSRTPPAKARRCRTPGTSPPTCSIQVPIPRSHKGGDDGGSSGRSRAVHRISRPAHSLLRQMGEAIPVPFLVGGGGGSSVGAVGRPGGGDATGATDEEA
ncbi:unnamed protein product, partial [Discosporangium mesarthrocarpum]